MVGEPFLLENYKTFMSYLILRCNLSLSMPTSMGISENTLRDFTTLLGKGSKACVAETVCYWGRGTCFNIRPKDYICEGKNVDLGWLVSSSRGDTSPHMNYGGQTISVTPIWGRVSPLEEDTSQPKSAFLPS